MYMYRVIARAREALSVVQSPTTTPAEATKNIQVPNRATAEAALPKNIVQKSATTKVTIAIQDNSSFSTPKVLGYSTLMYSRIVQQFITFPKCLNT